MKIEKLNDRQIRCTLTSDDLASRHIQMSELAYGNEKTKELFRDMMSQASMDLGFEAEDIPLMIEAIPLSPEKIVLIITKVEAPEELDTRFSNFTQWDSDEDGEEESDSDLLANAVSPTEDLPPELVDFINHMMANRTESSEAADTETPADTHSAARLFVFTDLNDAIDASELIADLYHGASALYKDTVSEKYLLILHQGAHPLSDFNKIIHILSSALPKHPYKPAIEAFCKEHCRTILPKHAIGTLAGLK